MSGHMGLDSERRLSYATSKWSLKVNIKHPPCLMSQGDSALGESGNPHTTSLWPSEPHVEDESAVTIRQM